MEYTTILDDMIKVTKSMSTYFESLTKVLMQVIHRTREAEKRIIKLEKAFDKTQKQKETK